MLALYLADWFGIQRFTTIIAYIAHLATIAYDKRLSRAERVSFDVDIDVLYAAIYVIFSISRKTSSLVLKPYGLHFA